MKLNFILALFVMLGGSLFAATWAPDGQGGVYWEQNGARISAFPATASSPVGNLIQYVNFTYSNANAITTNMSFVFDSPILDGHAYLLQTVTRTVSTPIPGRLNYTLTINDVQSYVTSSQPCQVGDAQNPLKYLITYGNSNTSSFVACFASYVNNSNNYILTYQLNGTTGYTQQQVSSPEWVEISGSFSRSRFGNYDVYTISNVPFTQGTNYQVKFIYRVSQGSIGKFSIYAHAGSPQDVVFNGAQVYVELDPWWNATYANRSLINCTSIASGTPIVINGSSGFAIGGKNQVVWTNCQPDLYLYYNNFTDYAVANNTSQVATEVELGNGTSYNPTSVWSNLKAVFHMNNNSESTGTKTTSTTGTVTFSSGKIGNAGSGFGSANYINTGTTYTAATNQSWSYWVNWQGGGGENYFLGNSNNDALAIGAYQGHNYNCPNGGGTCYGGDDGFLSSHPTQWVFVVWTYNQTNNYDLKAYGNGALLGSGTGPAQIASNANEFRIGRRYSAQGEYPSGMDEVRFYNTPLSAAEINQTYQNMMGTAGYGVLGANEANPAATYSVSFLPPTPNTTNYVAGPLVVNASRSSSDLNNATLFVNGTAYAMQINNDSQNSTNRSVSLADGSWTFYVFANNSSVSSVNATTPSRTVTIDSTPPSSLSITSPTASRFYWLNATVNLSFTEANFKNCTLSINGTNVSMTQVGASLCQYNITNTVGNVTLIGYIADLANNTAASSPVTAYLFNFTAGVPAFMNPEYDIYADTLNLTVTTTNYFGDFSANVSYNGNNSAASCSAGPSILCQRTVQPSQVSGITLIPITWSYAFANASLNFSTSNTTNLHPSGLLQCGNLTNTTAVNYSIIDSSTSLPLAVTYLNTYSSTTVIRSITSIASSYSWCIYPTWATLAVNTSETYNANNYAPLSVSRSFTASSSSVLYTVIMTNLSVAQSTQLKVVVAPALQAPGAFITVERLTFPSTYTVQTTCTTDATGTCVVSLSPNTVQYRFTITYGSQNYTFGPEVISCSSTASLCYRTFTLGTSGQVDYFSQPKGTCTYTNATQTLACSSIGNSTSVVYGNLSVYLVGTNATATSVCSQSYSGSTGSLSCVLSGGAGTYFYIFYGKDAANVVYYFASGYITGKADTTQNFGLEGLLIAAIVLICIAAIGVYSLTVSIILMDFAVISMQLMGIMNVGWEIIVGFVLISAMLIYKLRM